MSAAPPPPPQLGLPPPPMPGGGGGGPPPPPSAAVPPPMNNRMNHHQRGPPRNPYTNQILLTDIPPFLHSLAAIREWLYPCGTTRTVVLYPKPKTSDDDNENKKDDKGATKEEAEEKGTALITMSHPDAAVKVVGSFPVFSAHLDERYNGIQVYLIPPSPELPLPPISMDKETKQVLGEKLWSQWITLESNQGPTHNPMNRNSYNNNSSNDKTGDAADITLDADKVAAAAGGVQYDEDDDPLSAPHVLEAVKQFRRNLLTTSSSQQKQRLALVQRTLERMRPVIRQRVDQEKANASAVPLPNPNLPPPPMPGGLPPPPPPSAAGGGGGADSGKRGRSNLPAWMTAQQEAGGDGEGEPDAKKSKTQAETFPANIPEAKHADLRTFISSQISEFMGEAPDDLVDMVHSHVIGGKATQALVTELQEVLEDDTQTLIQAVWNKVNELL